MKITNFFFITIACLFLLYNQHVKAASVRAPKFDFAVENSKGQTLYFHILSKELHTVSITRGPSSYGDTEYVIPEKVQYEDIIYEVIAVADKAFYEKGDIERISLPNTIKSIGFYAFEDCSFQSFIFPDSLKEVKEGAFKNTIIEHSGLDEILSNLVGIYFTKPNVKGGYRIHEARRYSVSFINDVTGVERVLSDLRNIEEDLFKYDSTSCYQPLQTKVEITNRMFLEDT